MTQTSDFKLCDFDVDFMKGTWEGPGGAAFNSVYEDLVEAGLVTGYGQPTKKGYEALDEYVPEPKQLSLDL